MRLFRSITYCLFISICFTASTAHSQNNELVMQEDNLIQLSQKLSTFINVNFDSVSLYSSRFEDEMTNLIEQNPSTLAYSFRRLIDSNFCNVTTSVDGNFRMYSWDTWTGGTMHFFKTIYQWRANGKVFFKTPYFEEGDPGSFCSKIFTVAIAGKPNYLAITNSRFSTKDLMQSISAFRIDANKLNDNIELFKTKTKSLNAINVNFDFFSVVDRTERPLELITYDEKRVVIYIPLVNENFQVTDKHILYQLKGNHFNFIGFERGKR